MNHKLPSSLEYSDSPSVPLASTLLEHILKPLHFTYSSCTTGARYSPEWKPTCLICSRSDLTRPEAEPRSFFSFVRCRWESVCGSLSVQDILNHKWLVASFLLGRKARRERNRAVYTQRLVANHLAQQMCATGLHKAAVFGDTILEKCM